MPSTENLPLKNKRFCVVMRHEKSIAATYGFLSGLGASIPDFLSIVLEKTKDTEDDFNTKKNILLQATKNNDFDVLILATKINDTDSDSQLIPFLKDLKNANIGDTPIVMTHLSSMDESMKTELNTLGLNLSIVENDNLGFPKPTDQPNDNRTGMSKLGPAVLKKCDPVTK